MGVRAEVGVVDVHRLQTVAQLPDALVLIDPVAVGVPDVPAAAEERMAAEPFPELVEVAPLEDVVFRKILAAGVLGADADAGLLRRRQQFAVEAGVRRHELLPASAAAPDAVHHDPGDAEHLADVHFAFQYFDAAVAFFARVEAPVGAVRLHEVRPRLGPGAADAIRPLAPVVRAERRTGVERVVHVDVDVLEAALRQELGRRCGVVPVEILPEVSGAGGDFHLASPLRS